MNIRFEYSFFGDNGRLYDVKADIEGSYDYYKALKSVLKIYKMTDYSLIRLGSQDCDGGYIMADSFAEHGIAYSFGISNDVSWDSAIADCGYKIFMYDNTIDKLPYEREEFLFFKEGISGMDKIDEPLKTLSYYIDKNGHSHEKNMILKMDVEGAEWSFLETVDYDILNQFNQIIIEFHGFIQSENSDKKIKALEKLNKTHNLIHLHGNNTSYTVKIGNTVFPNVMEATYVNKNSYKTEEDTKVFLPIDIDRPNDYYVKDVELGKWNEPFML